MIIPRNEYLAQIMEDAAAALDRTGSSVEDLLAGLDEARAEIVTEYYGAAFMDELASPNVEWDGDTNSINRLLEGEIEDAPIPLRVFAAFGEKKHIIDYLAGRRRRGYREDAGHRQAGAHPFIGVVGKGGEIVGKYDPPLLGGPGKYHRIIRSAKTDILYAHDIARRTTSLDTPE